MKAIILLMIVMATAFQAAAVENSSDMKISEAAFNFCGSWRAPVPFVEIILATNETYETSDLWFYSVAVVGTVGSSSERVGQLPDVIELMKEHSDYDPESHGPFKVGVWLWENWDQTIGQVKQIVLSHNGTELDRVNVTFEYTDGYFKGLNATTVKF